MKTQNRPLGQTPEEKLSNSSIPSLRMNVAVLQGYAEPESFSVVDFALFIKICSLDREAYRIVSLIDSVRSIQEIADKAKSAAKTMEEFLEFFRLLHSRRVIEF